MALPIKGSFEVKISTDKQANNIVDALNEQERKRLLDALNKKMGTKEKSAKSKEAINNLPLDVATQDKKALAYFKKNKEPNHIKIVDHVKKLREQGKISYEDLGGGKYNVIMPCDNKKLKMYFPADTSLSDVTFDYTDWDGSEISNKETTRGKLWSKKGKKYLDQKKQEGQTLLFKPEFKTLIQSLYPEGAEEEQIVAFMIATGFYGRMGLADKITDCRLAVGCYRGSDSRRFYDLNLDVNGCSIVYTSPL